MIADTKVSYPGKKHLLGRPKSAAIPPSSRNCIARAWTFVKRAHSCKAACITIGFPNILSRPAPVSYAWDAAADFFSISASKTSDEVCPSDEPDMISLWHDLLLYSDCKELQANPSMGKPMYCNSETASLLQQGHHQQEVALSHPLLLKRSSPRLNSHSIAISTLFVSTRLNASSALALGKPISTMVAIVASSGGGTVEPAALDVGTEQGSVHNNWLVASNVVNSSLKVPCPAELGYPEKPSASRKSFAKAVPMLLEAECNDPCSVLRRPSVNPLTRAVKKDLKLQTSFFLYSPKQEHQESFFFSPSCADVSETRAATSESACKHSKCLLALPRIHAKPWRLRRLKNSLERTTGRKS
nr:hypothetical protein Iba_chr01dCG8900 [Ipomoea batatas]